MRAVKACADCQRRKVRCPFLRLSLSLSFFLNWVSLVWSESIYRSENSLCLQKRCRHLLPGSEPESEEPSRKRTRVQESNVSNRQAWIRHGEDGHHARDGLMGSRLISDSVPDSPTARRTTSTEPVLGAASAVQTERFVGDLNPEAVIRERLHESSATPLRDRIGLWIHSADRVDAASRSFSSHEKTISNSHYHGQHHHRRRPSEAPDEAFSSAHSIAERRLFQQYESAMQACDRLPWSTVEPLTTLYFTKINPIIPLLDPSTRPAQALDTTVTPAAAANPQRRFSPLLERAICLVAAKDPAVKPHLHLTNPSNTNTTGSRSRSRNPLPSRSFCTEIYHGLVSATHAGLEPDRYTRIRILALLSLHCEGYEGAEAASLHLCEAIHQAQTVGLHLARPGTSRDPHDALSLLFWGLWTLDKMHACLGGRPIILADRDIGLERPWGHERSKMGNVMDVGMENGMNEGQTGPTRPRTLSSKSNPDHGHLEPFRVWFRISEVLATVIGFYRPSAEGTSGWEDGFPAFEDLVGETVPGRDLNYSTLCQSRNLIPFLQRFPRLS